MTIADVILVVIFLVLGVSGLVIAGDCLTCSRRFTEQVDGEVSCVFVTHHITGSRRMAKFLYTYKGKEYLQMADDELSSAWVKKNSIKAGSRMKIYINPKKPTQIRTSNRNETATGIFLLLFSIGLLAAAGAEIITAL